MTHSSHTVNVVLPTSYLGGGPGSVICTIGTARLANPFLQIVQPEASFIIYRVCRAATALVVVLRAAKILPAFNFASIQVHYESP